MHTCIHAYMHTYMHAYIHTYIHTYIHACMHACMHTYIHTYIHCNIVQNWPRNVSVRGKALVTKHYILQVHGIVHRCAVSPRRVHKKCACLRNDAFFEADRSWKGSRAWCLIVKHLLERSCRRWRSGGQQHGWKILPQHATSDMFSMMSYPSWYCISDRLVAQEDDLNPCPTDPTNDHKKAQTQMNPR